MKKSIYIVFFYFLFGILSLYSQKTDAILIAKDSTKLDEIDPLRPAKAAFYSAVLPGLGQAYNKKYWKIPIVYGAMGVSLYNYLDQNKKYKSFRDAYKLRLKGLPDEYSGVYNDATLISAQRLHQRNRDLSLLATVVIYVLNIVDANVDAHLTQFNVNDKLSLAPDIYQNDLTSRPNLGLTLNFKF